MTDGTCHLHIDALGGIAGDMFIAAVLDACPDLTEEATKLVGTIGGGVSLSLVRDKRKGIAGHRVNMTLPDASRGPRHYPDYVAVLKQHAPDDGTKNRALDILRRLAEAEAQVHGVPLDRVHFHEISDWDSIADILLAAWALERLRVHSASVSALPTGGGRVLTEHGPLPVPAPATLLLLRGFELFDDGIAGERITPTGAAILAHLKPAYRGFSGVIDHVGYGLGKKDFDAVANVLRLSFGKPSNWAAGDLVAELQFHVDDQSPEDLAIGLDHIRATQGVLDVLQSSALGKKNRLTIQVEVICERPHLDTVVEACFHETTTIGLRYRLCERVVLRRGHTTDQGLHLKYVSRPDGVETLKVEADDLVDTKGHHNRQKLRTSAVARQRSDGQN